METSYQEKILEKYHSFDAVKDCFAISRLHAQIVSIARIPGPSSIIQKSQIQECNDELYKILAKYSDAIEPTQP